MASLNEDDVDTLVAVSGYKVDRDQAAQVLKISGYNVDTAMNKIFDALDNPDGITDLLKQGDTTWDGAAFGGLSGYGPYETGSTNTNVPTFHIDATHVGDYAHSEGPSAAPTRPPSRTSQRPGSAMSTHMGDVPMQSSFYSEEGSWNNIEPLTGFSGVEGVENVESGQEWGVVGNAGTAGVLRPATQNYYDSASWALVTTTKSSEYIPDAALHDQIRGEEPGFIKPTVGDNHLPALLTILHSIPLVRNALLAPEVSTTNYWRGEDWWKGSASTASVTLNVDTGSEVASELEFLYEVQRLMAFLDSSQRTYASLESLLQLDAWTQATFASPEELASNGSDLLKFLLRWGWMYQKHVPTAQLGGVLRSTVDVGGSRKESSVLEIEMNTIDKGLTEPTLYDYIDEILFADSGSAHIIDPSNVLVLWLNPRGSKRNCKIPATLYADRYLEGNRAVVEENFTERKKYHELLATLEANVEKLKYHTPQKIQYPKKMETLTLLKTSMRAFDSDTEVMTESPRDAAVLAHLQSLYQNIERKLFELEEQKTKAKEALDEVSKRFRAPFEDHTLDSEASEGSPQHKFAHPYRLCGIAKSKTEYYIRHPVKDVGDFAKDEAWWHIKYALPGSGPEDHASITRSRKDISDVLANVSEVSEAAVLVYANNAAFLTAPIPLSARLDTFIKKDNMNFQQEVADAKTDWLDHDPNEGAEVAGNWLEGDDGWGNNMNAKNYQQQDHFGSTVSSKTLTPDTDPTPPAYHEDDVVNITLSPEHEPEPPMEMQEINGGISAWAGHSNASSETVGAEPMSDVMAGDGRESTAKNRAEDVLMGDTDTTEHIEVVEKKGG